MKTFLLAMTDRHPTLVEDRSERAQKAPDDFAALMASEALHGLPVPTDVPPVRLKVANETVKKKGVSDIQTHFTPFLIFSRRAFDSLSDLLLPAGQVVRVDERFPGLIGLHVTKVLDGVLDEEKSDCITYPTGLMVRRPVLRASRLAQAPIFKIGESTRRVFVSDEFRERVEAAKLNGFSFQQEVQLSP